MVSNAALRYQPTNLSEEKIADMIFNAGLANMNDEQRKAAQEAQAQTQNNENANAGRTNAGITGLMMGGGGRGTRMRGGRQGSGPGRDSEPVVVMRNLWYIGDDSKLEVMQVPTGISSGSLTEIRSREDIEGKQVILREKI